MEAPSWEVENYFGYIEGNGEVIVQLKTPEN